MGKNNRHKKFLKQEKAKVQLKASKKLTKGQNITDTRFKVKKIVLLTQLTSTPESQPQTNKNLNLKELLSRTRHHNVNMRLDALGGLRELAIHHPELLITNLCNFLETSAARCTNEESHLVRQESLQLLHYVLEKVSAVQLEPFISMLILHLSTGMTHLQRGIQEDALRMLDIVLAVAPDLVAQATPILLPAFLDQISMKQTTGSGKRTLSLDLQSSNTSTNWRIKVLGRLHAMLSAATSNSMDSDLIKSQTIYWSPTISPYIPLYKGYYDKPCTIKGVFSTGPTDLRSQQNLFQDETEMKKYISILVPLLFETWAEAGPSQKQIRQIGSVITADAAELLDCVLETLQCLWHYLEICEQGSGSQELTKWFRQSFRNDFICHLIKHFPYFATTHQGKKFKQSKGQTPFEQELEISCHKQNLAICHLFCCLCNKPTTKQAQVIEAYTLRSLSTGQRLTEQLVQVLECMLLKEANQFEASGMNIKDIASSVVHCCLKSSNNIQNSPLFNLLCDLSLSTLSKNKSNYNLVRPTIYSKFLEELPSILTMVTITAKGLKTISQLAAAQEPVIMLTLKQYIPGIIENLHQLSLDDEDQKIVQMSVLGVLYQASLWRVDILDTVANSLLKHKKDLQHLLRHFQQLMQLQLEKDPLCLVSQKLKSMPWFFEENNCNTE